MTEAKDAAAAGPEPLWPPSAPPPHTQPPAANCAAASAKASSSAARSYACVRPRVGRAHAPQRLRHKHASGPTFSSLPVPLPPHGCVPPCLGLPLHGRVTCRLRLRGCALRALRARLSGPELLAEWPLYSRSASARASACEVSPAATRHGPSDKQPLAQLTQGLTLT